MRYHSAVLLLAVLTSQVIDLAQKETLLVVRMSPKAQENPLSSERLFRLGAQAIGAESRLTLLSAEQAGVDEARLLECELDRRLSCWAAEVRSSADHLLVVSMLEQEGKLDVTGFLVDVRAARGKTENEIFERTPVARGVLSHRDRRRARRLLPRAPATDRGASASGSIAIEVDAPDLSIAVDGRTTVGVARVGTTIAP